MVSVRQMIHRASRRVGVEIKRYPNCDPLWRVVQLLHHHKLSTVLDVGANDGGYAMSIRQHGYSGRLLSFEPLNDPFSRLQKNSMADDLWKVTQCAIGNEDREVTINVAANGGASSSILPMLQRHVAAAPDASYVSKEIARQYRLDEIVPPMVKDADNLYLKIDVQGYERSVLNGAERLLSSGQVIGMQLELSFVPLYDGGMTWLEGFQCAADYGMTLMALDPGFSDMTIGQTLQADAVFFREGVIT
jgi:FkbM family methyltransferase